MRSDEFDCVEMKVNGDGMKLIQSTIYLRNVQARLRANLHTRAGISYNICEFVPQNTEITPEFFILYTFLEVPNFLGYIWDSPA